MLTAIPSAEVAKTIKRPAICQDKEYESPSPIAAALHESAGSDSVGALNTGSAVLLSAIFLSASGAVFFEEKVIPGLKFET